MGRRVGTLLISVQVLRNESYENRNGILLKNSKRQSMNGKEFDTYKVGTTANSTSTMHKITSKPITMDLFELDDYNSEFAPGVQELIDWLEWLRKQYLETKDKHYWKELIRWLPEGWLQTRTVTMNYENLYSMVRQRRHHKQTEWSGTDEQIETESFIKFAHSLPYADELIFLDLN